MVMHIAKCVYNINEVGVWWFQSLRELGLCFVKHKNDIHVPACSTPEAIAIGCLVFEPSRLRFRAHSY